MKKVLIIANSSCGLYLFRKELITKLIKDNEVIALTILDGKEDELVEIGCKLEKINFDRRGMNPLKDINILKKYYKFISNLKPELVITYTIKPNIYAGVICRFLKIPYAVNITGLGTAFEQDGFIKKIVIIMYKIALKNAKVVFFENASNRNVFKESQIIKSRQMCLLNGAGVNTKNFSYKKYPQNTRFRFLFVGRVMKEKGIDELLKSIELLNIHRYHCILDIVGGFDEDYGDKLKEYENKGWIQYHGFQNDVRPFYESCNCFVLPSYHEGMANTNLEAASTGRPIITSNIPGCKEAVVDGVTGLLCKSKSVKNLFFNMKKILEYTNDELEKMGIKGRAYVLKKFDKKKVVKRTIDRLFI